MAAENDASKASAFTILRVNYDGGGGGWCPKSLDTTNMLQQLPQKCTSPMLWMLA